MILYSHFHGNVVLNIYVNCYRNKKDVFISKRKVCLRILIPIATETTCILKGPVTETNYNTSV
jgi:hypothetical protein